VVPAIYASAVSTRRARCVRLRNELLLVNGAKSLTPSRKGWRGLVFEAKFYAEGGQPVTAEEVAVRVVQPLVCPIWGLLAEAPCVWGLGEVTVSNRLGIEPRG
jgi:hypothetical protein